MDNDEDNKDTPKTAKDTVDAAIADAPQELTDQVVIDLAGLTPLEYVKKINKTAKACRVPVRHLEKLVEIARVETEIEHLLEAHWEVTPASDPVDAVKLFADIEARILYQVAMPRHLAFVVALWIGLSWIHEHATYSPILFITSAERDSGKTTLVGVIGFLARRALLSVGISPAALYRSIERWQPSFVIDEADEAFVDNPDLRQVINSGWTRGQGVVRCDADTHEPRRFSTFCPKAIAIKGRKAPDTILSRAIFIPLKRRTGSESIAHFDHADDAGFVRQRSQLARWAADHGEALGRARPAMPAGFLNRLASNWQLIFAIADSLGEEAGRRAREAAQQIVEVTDLTSAGVALLQDVKTMFEASTLGYLTTREIVRRLTADPEKRWAEWSRGKPITEKGVAALLHEFGIFSRNVGSRDVQAKGYRREDFTEAWERYCAAETGEEEEEGQDPDILPSTRPRHCNHSTFAEKSAVHRSSGGREKNWHFSNEIKAVGGWTGKNPDSAPSLVLPPTDDGSNGHGAPLAPVDDGLLDSLRRCAYCGRPGAQRVAFGDRPGTVPLHRECEAAWEKNQPALGPLGDDLGDLR